MRTSEARRQIEELGPWFHNLHLPGGLQTAPDHFLGDFPQFKWDGIRHCFPDDLSGQRVLDIGCNAGFYSFALAARGAEVTGMDSDARYLRQARWVQELLGERRVRFVQGSVYDVDRLEGPFDIVLFMGVLYHLRHPLLALDLIARLQPATLVFQTLTFGDERVSPHARRHTDFATRHLLADPSWPHLAFIEERFSGDPTNWWVPNHAAAEAMLRSAGFRVRGRPAHETYLCDYCGERQAATPEDPSAAHEAVRRLEREPRRRTG